MTGTVARRSERSASSMSGSSPLRHRALGRVGAQVVDTVDRILFRPVRAWPCAVARIVLGLAIVGWAVSMMFDAGAFLAEDGLVGVGDVADGRRWFDLSTLGDARLALVVLAVAGMCVAVGLRPSIALAVSFVLLTAVQRRAPIVLNSGDVVLRDLSLLLAFAGSGRALSWDRWRRLGRDGLRSAGHVAPWGLRLVQLQVTTVYLFAAFGKSGELWRDGTAVSTALRLVDLQRVGRLDALVENVVVVAALTWGTLALETALGTLLWVRRMRPALIVAGVSLHLLIDSFLLVGFFGIAMVAGLAAFLDGERIEARLARSPGAAGPAGRSAGEDRPAGRSAGEATEGRRELGPRSVGDDGSLLDHDHPVGASEGGPFVGRPDDRPAALPERLPELDLGRGVEG